MMIRRWIKVTFQKEGIHKYPAAATDPKLADVSFLAHPHRHIFHFSVRISVQQCPCSLPTQVRVQSRASVESQRIAGTGNGCRHHHRYCFRYFAAV
jgi:hypothetical protein